MPETSANAVALAERFMSLFSGSKTTHGTYDLSNQTTREDGKLQGKAATKHSPVTLALWEQHLMGSGPGLGIVPIREDNRCTFGAIDVDFYQGLDLRAIVAKLQRNKIPLIVCRSKSGGAHIYCFSKEPVQASLMKAKLAEVSGFIGFGGSEIFPKQSQILADRGDAGSWISAPYYQGTRGMRYAVDIDGNALSPEAFLFAAEQTAVDTSWFTELLVINSEFPDGPPCLQALSQIGYPVGTRNDGLMAIGVYLKKSRPDDWENALDEYNHKYLHPPLTIPEVQGIAKSLKRKDYTYSCSKQPIAAHCNAALCRTMKFGVSNGMNGRFPILSGLSKLTTKPPVWYWTVNEVRMELSTEEIQDTRKFQRRCMECLNIFPQMPAAPTWQAAVQHAMDGVTIIEAPKDASPEGQFWEMLEKFCTSRSQALSLEEITLGKPHTEKGRTSFRMMDLLAYLSRQKFFEFKTTKIASILKDAGAEHHFSIFNGRGTNYWSLPAFPTQSKKFDVPGEVKEGEAPF